MSSDDVPEDRHDFAYFSNEYSQALQALKAIETQAATLLTLGGSDDLRTFIAQFIEMAMSVKRAAEEADEPYFAEWFDELIQKAEALRTEIVSR